jgi:thiosulfate/3-mercaptopyruvate sulfurtransferase
MVPLISAQELMTELRQEAPPVVLDVRWTLAGASREEYERGHVPGAVFVDLDNDLASTPGPAGRHPLPDPESLQQALRAAGVEADRSVVAYDGGHGMASARMWWLLRWAGHEPVAVLDGGYDAWIAEGLPVSTEEAWPKRGDVVVRPGHMPVVDAEGAAVLAREARLLDARSPERYRGEVEPMDKVAGHVPGALNTPVGSLSDASGRLKPAAELADQFARLGVEASSRVGVYCGSGVSACSVLLALERAGLSTREHPAELYVGSWSNWSADPRRPVATGEQPG